MRSEAHWLVGAVSGSWSVFEDPIGNTDALREA
jgi:hypothetical protein